MLEQKSIEKHGGKQGVRLLTTNGTTPLAQHPQALINEHPLT